MIGRKTATNMGIANSWAEVVTMGIWFFTRLWFGQKFFNLAFSCYLHLLYFKSAAVTGGRNSISQPSAIPVRCLQF